ncbi:beta-galactosidase GalA [Niabella hirudinis]|uniref:beta-galactosidase GalA n=1 Tax=Niabella hirudinis TaxID=1285929 RepID=UPI003EBD08DD
MIRFCFFARFVLFLLLGSGLQHLQAQPQVREKLSLDKGWLFHLGDIPFPVIKGHGPSYATSKAGSATGAASPKYDDKHWRRLSLPHDWSSEMPFDSSENLSQGFRKRGYGWYRRHFKLDSTDRGKNIELQFDGIATNAEIWVNGTTVHRNWCGYTSSYIDITPLALYGNDKTNVIAVRVDAVAHEGWWYEGAGIYRHTWLVKRPSLHITTDGVYANPIKKAGGNWLIPAEVTIANAGTAPQDATIAVNLVDRNNKIIGSASAKVQAQVLQETTAKILLDVANPTLWDVDNPYLYKVVATIRKNNMIIDEVTTKCGFRTIQFRADSGFYLNGRQLKIKGTCNHLDHAGVGVAVPDALWAFRLGKLKEMGSNAYRCSHNPPPNELLEACDSIGMLVMDENRNFNTSDEYVRQLQWLVRRDRNHPSVILWSVFNEEPFQGEWRGYEMVRYMSARVKELDTTRPVTAAQSGGQLNPVNVSQAADVVGFNYQQHAYDAFHKKYPDKPLISSEDGSAVMTRGAYVTNRKASVLGSYDTEFQPWGNTHRKNWELIDKRPFVAGGFYWTGFDYHGEPQPNEWPAIASVFGIMDLCGFPKSAFWIHQAQWRNDRPVLHLSPHWNWPADSIGKKIKVMAFSNTDSIALLLNGKKLGGQKADKYAMNTWYVPYHPGKLEAIGYNSRKKIVARFSVETTGMPYALQLIPDRNALKNDGWDAMPITVQAVDKKGRSVPVANNKVTFEVADGAVIIGVGNGDPLSHEPEKGNQRSLFNGLAQLIIQSREGANGQVKIIARAEGLKPAEISLSLSAVPVPPFVPEVKP